MNNPNLLNIGFFFNSLKKKQQLYDIEDTFMFFFFNDFSDLKKKIPNISYYSSLKNYKENITLLTHFIFFEEESIV